MAQIQASPVDAVRSSAKPGSMVTIRDVAKESGFSSTTVSIVLNNAPLARYIPVATKKRIERAAKKLGYRPNLFARSLRSKRSHTVGVMIFDMTDPFCTLVLRGIENSLYQASYLPILTDVHNERARFERYLEMLLDRRVEALVVLANWLFVDIDVLADLEKSSIPTVMIGRELQTDSVSSVIGFDDVAASGLYTPPLTTVRQPMEAMGAMAVSIVVEGINGVLEKREVSAIHRKMAPELAVRESTRSVS